MLANAPHLPPRLPRYEEPKAPPSSHRYSGVRGLDHDDAEINELMRDRLPNQMVCRRQDTLDLLDHLGNSLEVEDLAARSDSAS